MSPSSSTPGQRFRTSLLQVTSTCEAAKATTWQSNRHRAHINAAIPSNKETTTTFSPFLWPNATAPCGSKTAVLVRWYSLLWHRDRAAYPSSVKPPEQHRPPPASLASEHVTKLLMGARRSVAAKGTIASARNSSCNCLGERGLRPTSEPFGQAACNRHMSGLRNSKIRTNLPNTISNAFTGGKCKPIHQSAKYIASNCFAFGTDMVPRTPSTSAPILITLGSLMWALSLEMPTPQRS